MVGDLPCTVTVNGVEYKIRTDYRDILKILVSFGDPELDDSEKVYVCMVILFENLDSLPKDDYEEAFEAARKFIDYGVDDEKSHSPRTMDWEQDENLLFPAINKIAGYETRTADYIHWWTFLGYYMEISEGIFSTILSIRQKKSKGKKLEKWEREFWNANKSLCVLKEKLTAEEQAEKDRLNALIG